MRNETNPGSYDQAALEKLKNGSDPDHYANTDWMDEIMQTGHMQQHSLSVSGGSENVQFMTSINYSDQKGITRIQQASAKLRNVFVKALLWC